MTPLSIHNRLRHPVASACLGILLLGSLQGQTPDEYQVKAAFIFNFAKFVDWPQSALSGPADPIRICLLGKDPFGPWLKEAIAGHAIEGHSLSIRHIDSPGDIGDCQMLFVNQTEPKRVWQVISAKPGLLTVGDSPDALAAGAVIAFAMEADRVRFEINTTAAERSQFKISSRLLTVARVLKR